MNILLIQSREEKVLADHEKGLIVKFAGLDPDSINCVNVISDTLSEDLLNNTNAIVIGGSGDHLMSSGDIPEKIESICKLLRSARGKGIPMIGLCFGGQLITKAFGGTVVLDEENAETGTFEITKTPEAIHDPIYSNLPDKFFAQLGHKDHVGEMPDGAIRLAFSERSSVQAFTFEGEPIYATIFHPEMDDEATVFRLVHYARQFGLSDLALQELKDSVKPSNEAVRVLQHFFDHVVVRGERYRAVD